MKKSRLIRLLSIFITLAALMSALSTGTLAFFYSEGESHQSQSTPGTYNVPAADLEKDCWSGFIHFTPRKSGSYTISTLVDNPENVNITLILFFGDDINAENERKTARRTNCSITADLDRGNTYLIEVNIPNPTANVEVPVEITYNDGDPRDSYDYDYPEEGYYKIYPLNDGGTCLDIGAATIGDQEIDNLRLWPSGSAQTNVFYFERDYERDAYIIREPKSQKVLDVFGTESAPGMTIMLWNDDGADDQRWIFRDDGIGSLIFTKQGGYMDIEGGTASEDANVYCAAYSGENSQHWILQKINYTENTPGNGTVADKKTVKVPPEVHLHYTGKELTAFEETNLYTVYDAKKTNTGSYYAILTLKNPDEYKWESTNSSNSSEVIVPFDIHKYSDSDGNGYCDSCNGVDGYDFYVDYLEKKVSGSSVVTEEKLLDCARVVSPVDSTWGISGDDTWYVVDSSITLQNRVEVKGNVHLILKNNKTLTSYSGITVEGNNSLSIYAQSDAESTMGKLIVETYNVTAIGGRNGGDGIDDDDPNGRNGNSCGKVNFYGGKISLKTTNLPCIGGGNGGNATSNRTLGSNGGNGGSGGNVYFYGGEVSLKADYAACIGGGKGGDGKDAEFTGFGGDSMGYNGGSGSSGRVYFYAGNTVFSSFQSSCIGSPLTENYWNVFGSPDIKTGDSAENASPARNQKYNGERYLSVIYASGSTVGSVLSQGSIWIVSGVAVLAAAAVMTLIVVKKKKPAAANTEE